jgi:hypothetical protein
MGGGLGRGRSSPYRTATVCSARQLSIHFVISSGPLLTSSHSHRILLPNPNSPPITTLSLLRRITKFTVIYLSIYLSINQSIKHKRTIFPRTSFATHLVALKRAVLFRLLAEPMTSTCWKHRCWYRRPSGSSSAEKRPGCLAVHHPERWSHQKAVCSTPRRCGDCR